MTAYALLSYINLGKQTEAFPITRWLVSQRNENGGFSSTQDTVVGLEALATVASKMFSSKNEIDIDIEIDGKTSNLQLNEDNALILQKHELNPTARNFEISAKGNGVGIVQFSYRYNIDSSSVGPSFILNSNLHESSNKNFMHLIICTKFVSDSDFSEESNMAVLEVELASGFIFDIDTIDDLKLTINLKVSLFLCSANNVLILIFEQHFNRKSRSKTARQKSFYTLIKYLQKLILVLK
jgi:CD109 antigen